MHFVSFSTTRYPYIVLDAYKLSEAGDSRRRGVTAPLETF